MSCRCEKIDWFLQTSREKATPTPQRIHHTVVSWCAFRVPVRGARTRACEWWPWRALGDSETNKQSHLHTHTHTQLHITPHTHRTRVGGDTRSFELVCRPTASCTKRLTRVRLSACVSSFAAHFFECTRSHARPRGPRRCTSVERTQLSLFPSLCKDLVF
jgi:hypothetical protein